VTGGSSFWKRFSSNRTAVGGGFLLVAIVVAAVLGPLIYPVDPFDMVGRPQQPPFGRFPLGTDVAGRDMLAGLLNGARVSLLIGVMATLAATIVGVTLGAIGGYYGGWIDNVLMRVTELFLTIPSFVLAVVLVAIFSPNVVTITIAIAIVSWPSVARMTRGEFMAPSSSAKSCPMRCHPSSSSHR
jgi:peptide/nickel transport system permease protein